MNWQVFFIVIGGTLLMLAWAASLIYTVEWLNYRWWNSGWALVLPLLVWFVVPLAVMAGLIA